MKASKDKINVLVVGQTPPPYGGQAVMIQYLLSGTYKNMQLHHVRMSYSKEMDQIGRLKPGKIWHLFSVILRIYAARIRYRTHVLYYPPAGPNKVPFYRDCMTLMCVRWMFKCTVFHFHAGGISTLYSTLSAFEQWMYRRAYTHPDLAISPAADNPDDGGHMQAHTCSIIPHGIPDEAGLWRRSYEQKTLRILYVGVMMETKGVLDLIRALAILRPQHSVELELVGRFESDEIRKRVLGLIDDYHLGEVISLSGVLTGSEKHEAFKRADIFCYPTFFESESFGLVVLEAMQWSLPVIVTDWRGVPALVREGDTGFIVPAKEPSRLAEAMKRLTIDADLRRQMGRRGRERFEQTYALPVWHNRMEDAIIKAETKAY